MLNHIKPVELPRQKLPLFCLLISTAFLVLTPSQAFAGVSDLFASISETLGAIKDSVSGIAAFVSRILDVTKFLGFKTILLLVAVIIISSGLSSTGIAKGRPAFFLALAIADAICILWLSGFKGFRDDLISSLLPLTKSNLFITLPFIVLWLMKKSIPALKVQSKRLLFAVTGRKLSERRKEISALSRQLLAKNMELHNAILDNLENKSSMGLSAETKTSINEIKKLIKALEKQNKTTGQEITADE